MKKDTDFDKSTFNFFLEVSVNFISLHENFDLALKILFFTRSTSVDFLLGLRNLINASSWGFVIELVS